MKLKNLIIGFIAFVAIAPVSASAASSLIVDCKKTTIMPNETIKCELKGKSDKKITGIKAHITLGENLSLVSANVNKDFWMGDGIDGNYDLAAEAYPYPTGDFAIGTFEVKAGSITTGFNSGIAILSPNFVDDSFDTFSVSDINKSIRIGSTVNTLSKLVVDGKEVDLTKELKATVDKASAEISANATDQNAKISGTGKVDLKYGENKVDITVTSEAGTTKSYTLLVTRPDNRSSDNTLAKLTIGSKEIDLTKELAFELDAESIEIAATANDEKATISGDIGKLDLKKGENNFVIKVTAENETTKEYKIKITTPQPEDEKLEGDGPKTGVNDSTLIIGGLILVVGACVCIILKKKNKFIKL